MAFSNLQLSMGHPPGATLSRFQKMEDLSEFEPSFDFLSVCYNGSRNCGRCEKCVRTMLILDALGKLDLYRNVFDVDRYRENKQRHLRLILRQIHDVDHALFYTELYRRFKKQITLAMRVRVCLGRILTRLRHPAKLCMVALVSWCCCFCYY